MARVRKKRLEEAGELNMVALIDVAMQLLNFFLITSSPVAVMTNLDVFRPSPEKKQEKMETPPNLIRITIGRDGIALNDSQVTMTIMETKLTKLGSIDKNQTIMIMCSPISFHKDLVAVLDLCAKAGLRSLSVVSTN